MPMLISSKNHPLIKTLSALLTCQRTRKKLGKTVLEGVHLLDACAKANILPEHIIVGSNASTNIEISKLLAFFANKTSIATLEESQYKQIRTLGTSPSIMAIIAIPTPKLRPITQDSLIINGVQDNGNLGTLLRSAAATGFAHVLCTTGSVSAWSPKTLRASMGANFSLNIYENLDIDTLLTHVKTPCYATSSHTDEIIFHTDLRAPLALIMGHEGQGIDPQLLHQSHPIALPQFGQESLNVGVAGSVCLYEMMRQRYYLNMQPCSNNPI